MHGHVGEEELIERRILFGLCQESERVEVSTANGFLKLLVDSDGSLTIMSLEVVAAVRSHVVFR